MTTVCEAMINYCTYQGEWRGATTLAKFLALSYGTQFVSYANNIWTASIRMDNGGNIDIALVTSTNGGMNWTTPTVISNTSRGSNRTMTDVDLVMAGARTAIVYRNSYDGAIYFQQFTSGSINATSPFINISIPKSGCQLPSLALGADLDYLILMQCGSLSTANIYYSYGNASAGLSAAVTLSGTGLPLATIDQPLNVAVTSDGGQGWAATFLRPQVASGAFVVGLYSIGTLSSPQIYSFLLFLFHLRRAPPSPFILFSAFSFF